MVEPVERRVYLKDAEGGVQPFDAAELQNRLVGCFTAAGQAEESFMAEEIALALEYTLLNSPRPEPVFSRGEADAAVIRLLESVGFPEVARIFRRRGEEAVLRLNTDTVTVSALLTAHLGCSAERAERIAAAVSGAMEKLKIAGASPHLLLELARHYERETASEEADTAIAGEASAPRQTLTRQEIGQLLPAAPRALTEAGVLKISGITTLFPSIRFVFSMKKFAEMKGLSAPVTELVVEPLLNEAGAALEEARRAVSAALESVPPCCLTIPDMYGFLESFAGSAPDRGLAEELAGALCGALDCGLYRLTLE